MLLSVEALTATARGARLLGGVGFTLREGERLALLGASGSGKSLTGRALLALPPRGVAYSGAVRLEGEDLLAASERRLCALRGRAVTLIAQEPATALNPAHPIGRQIDEPLRLHTGLSAGERRARVSALLEAVGLAAAGVGPERYPHELSGGQRQRVAVAAALAVSPRLVVADEPTSALDSVAAARVLDLLFRLTAEAGAALVLITHDLAVARRAERVAVMAEGRVVEEGTPDEVLARPATAPARALVAGLAVDLPARQPPEGPPVLEALDVTVRRDGRAVVRGAGLSVAARERVALVGSSGSGKTTLVRALLGLLPLEGRVALRGAPVRPDDPALRRAVQMVWQDPATSLDPRRTVGWSVAEPLARSGLSGAERRARVAAVLRRVGLKPEMAGRRPHAFSGGQRQRIALARALVSEPSVLIADEPVSALDAALRAEVIGELDRLAREGLGVILIAHDLALVRTFADRVVVLSDGAVVEEGPTATLLAAPRHPATAALVEAAALAVAPPGASG